MGTNSRNRNQLKSQHLFENMYTSSPRLYRSWASQYTATPRLKEKQLCKMQVSPHSNLQGYVGWYDYVDQ